MEAENPSQRSIRFSMPFVTYKLMTRDNLRKRKIMKDFCVFFCKVILQKEMQKMVETKIKILVHMKSRNL
jgi:hypothetical protein